MEERKKAQDLFRETEPIFGEKTTFVKAFPSIESVKIQYSAARHGMLKETDGVRYLNEKSIGEFINCTNSLCYNGGFRIADEIRTMVKEKATEKKFSGLCQGNEASPKGRKVYRHCAVFFQGDIQIEYKPEESPIEKPS